MSTLTMRGLRAASHFPFASAKFTQVTVFQFRYASSAPSPARKDPPPSQPPPPSDINGPLTTLPAPLDLPTRGPDQGLPSFLFQTGKTYIQFYKTGVKNIYTNYKLCQQIKSRLSSSNTTLQQAVQNHGITRSEFQLLHRNKHDMKRVPIFALILLVCGEFTPLLVIALPAVVPWTCRIPRQIEKTRRKLEERRSESFRDLTSDLPPNSTPGNSIAGVENLDRFQSRHINASLGLSSKIWEWVFGPPAILLRKRVTRKMEYLDMDDKLVRRAGGFGGLSEEELKMACVDRGINALDRKAELLRRTLDSWLRSKEKVGMEPLLLTR